MLADYNHGYDRAGRLTSLRNQTSWVQDQYEIRHVLDRLDTYTYDEAGRLANWQQTLADLNSDLGVDLDGAWSDAPILDDAGNRTAGQVASNGNRLLSGGGKEYVYDQEGNLTRRWTGNGSQPETRYTWDHRNRLIEVGEYANSSATTPTQRVVMKYDNNDLLISKTVGTTTERYAYENGQRILQLDATGKTTHRFHYGPGQDALLADEVFGSGAVQDLLWTATDHLGTVRDVVTLATNVDGNLANHLEYDEHGVITRVVGEEKNNVAISARAIDAAFAGREFVDELGLYYNRGRWYDPATERFLSEDPAQADPNLYRYAENDPVNFVDPSGLSIQKPTNYLAGLNSPALSSFDYGLPRSSGSVVVDTFRQSTPSVTNTFPSLSISAEQFKAQSFQTALRRPVPVKQVVKVETIGSGKGLGSVAFGDGPFHSDTIEPDIRPLLRYALNTVFPPVQPSQRVTYDDGSRILYLNGSPSGESLANQAAILAPFLPKAGGLRTPSPNTPPALKILDNEPFYPNFPRLTNDLAVSPKPPNALPLNRPIGQNAIQKAELQRDIVTAKKMGARDMRVNQHQVNANGTRVGANQPDRAL